MKCSDAEKQKIQETLKSAYFAREHTEVDLNGRWRTDLMRDIRRLGPLNTPFNPFLMFNRVVWRFAEVACVIALILTAYVSVTGWNPVEAAASFYFTNPVEFTVTQVLGEYESYE